MNRHRRLILLALLIGIVGACYKEHDKPRDSYPQYEVSGETDPLKDTLFLDSLFDRLLLLQQTVIRTPEDSQAIKYLLASALDTVADRLFIIGQSVSNLDSTREPLQGRTRLNARINAQQWAFLLKSGMEGTAVRYGMPLKGKLLYIRELVEKQNGDTLRILFMTPVGSVVMR
jgi:hypothetical protein